MNEGNTSLHFLLVVVRWSKLAIKDLTYPNCRFDEKIWIMGIKQWWISNKFRPFGRGPTTPGLGDLRSPWANEPFTFRHGMMLEVEDSLKLPKKNVGRNNPKETPFLRRVIYNTISLTGMIPPSGTQSSPTLRQLRIRRSRWAIWIWATNSFAICAGLKRNGWNCARCGTWMCRDGRKWWDQWWSDQGVITNVYTYRWGIVGVIGS